MYMNSYLQDIESMEPMDSFSCLMEKDYDVQQERLCKLHAKAGRYERTG